jgi:hypothetical protein
LHCTIRNVRDEGFLIRRIAQQAIDSYEENMPPPCLMFTCEKAPQWGYARAGCGQMVRRCSFPKLAAAA